MLKDCLYLLSELIDNDRNVLLLSIGPLIGTPSTAPGLMEVILGVTSSVVGHIASVQNGAQSHLSEAQFPTISEGVFTRVRNPELTASLMGGSASIFVFSFIRREETKKSNLDQNLDQAKLSHPAVRIFQFG